MPSPSLNAGHRSQVAGRPYLLFLSRLYEKKGTDLLIRAYVQLREQWRCDGKSRTLPALVVAGPRLDTDYGPFAAVVLINATELTA